MTENISKALIGSLLKDKYKDVLVACIRVMPDIIACNIFESYFASHAS